MLKTASQNSSGAVLSNVTINGATITGATLTATGAITPSQTVGIVGTTTNNNVQAGSVGEYVSSTVLSASAVSLTNNTIADITSIALTAGDWDVWGTVVYGPYGAGASSTLLLGWINSVSATQPIYPAGGGSFDTTASGNPGIDMQCPGLRARFLLAGNTSIYLSAYSTFSGGTLKAYGFIGARRVR